MIANLPLKNKDILINSEKYLTKNFSSISKKYFRMKNKLQSTPDYIIIGGGSAGCVLANRLSEDPKVQVLLIEAGHNDKGKMDSWKIHMPAALTYNIATEKYNWNYYTEEQQNLKNRKLLWPRGKVLGGSSSLNAMCYVRGNALDYDRWAEELPGWEYKNCLPYFKKAQTHELGEDDYRGGNGPLYVTRGNTKNELFENFINSGIDCGYTYTDDMNGFKQEGFGPMDCTIYKGLRWSTSTAYLKPIKHRTNLEVRLNSYVNKILFDHNKNAIGVEVCISDMLGNQKISNLYTNKEIIISGGAINSPQLLMLSGVGKAEDLENLGIKSIHDLPGVGENLQDHLEVYLQSECTNPITLVKYANWWPNPINKLSAGVQWFLFGSGVCGTNHFEAGAFIRSKKGMKHPDIQYHFFPGAVEEQKDVIEIHAYQIHCGTMRPKSRGYLKLKSANPRDRPIIQPNLLSHPQDLEDLKDCVRLTVEVLNAKSFEKNRKRHLNFDDKTILNDKLLEDWLRKNLESAYHCVGTCAMGKVTEADGRVKGVNRLRVCDASLMPDLVSGNTNAPTIMMAEKISDMIKGKSLPSSNAPVYFASNWETLQR